MSESAQDTYEIEDCHGQTVARPRSLAEATRLFWVGFNSFKIVRVAQDGTRTAVNQKGRGA